MRLIDADAFITEMNDRIENAIKWGVNAIADRNDEIKLRAEQAVATYCEASLTAKKMPTVDAIEVVRCKDCKWGREVCGNIECSADSNLPPEYHGYEWFCPNGERIEDVFN